LIYKIQAKGIKIHINELFRDKRFVFQLGLALGNKFWQKVYRRMLGLYCLCKGEITFEQYKQSFKNYQSRTFCLEEYLYKKLPSIYNLKHFKYFGHDFDFNEFSPRDAFSLLREIYLLDQYQARKFLKPDSTVIDAGAHYGSFSVLAANLSSKGKVFSFEPVEKTRRILQKNTEFYGNIEIVGAALGAKTASGNISVGPHSNCNFVDDERLNANSNRYVDQKVTIMALDDFVASNHIERLSFIKIDTEGYERQVLLGAKKTIRKFRPVISMAAYHRPDDKIDLPKLIQEIQPGYKYYWSKKGELDLICYFPTSRCP